MVFEGSPAEDDEHLVLMEGNAETDFVVSNERFKNFLNDSLKQALESNSKSLDDHGKGFMGRGSMVMCSEC